MEESSIRRSNRRVLTPAPAPKAKRRSEDVFPIGTRTVVKKQRFLVPMYIDFTKWEMNSLLRYAALYKIQIPEDATKTDLIGLVSTHAANQPHAREAEVISTFLYANERHRRDVEEYSKF